MSTIYKEIVIEVSPEYVWDAIRDVGAVHRRLTPGILTDARLSGDERILRISGVVRPIDIGAGNVVESQFIANFQVAYDGKGVETKFTNQGWMSRFVNQVWPF